MESSSDKNWAKEYLLDPVNAPEPSQEDGPAGSHFRSSVNSISPAMSSYPTPPQSASPTQSTFHPTNPYASRISSGHSRQPSSDKKHLEPTVKETSSRSHRRHSSLDQRFPGDVSHRPLESIKKEYKVANRAPHLKRRHIPGADVIDVLDATGFGQYHHEGPYDATLLARNTSYQSSPVQALANSNNEALKATPRENIQDSLTKHVPLQGTAVIPSGEYTMDGTKMTYEEGADLMREEDAPGGAYKRYDFIKYHPDDLKGKGEPSFTIDRALKEHERKANAHRRIMSDGDSGYEMQARSRPVISRERSQSQSDMTSSAKTSARASGSVLGGLEGGVRRHNSTGRSFSEGLKSRFGSLRRNKKAISP